MEHSESVVHIEVLALGRQLLIWANVGSTRLSHLVLASKTRHVRLPPPPPPSPPCTNLDTRDLRGTLARFVRVGAHTLREALQ